MTEKYKKGGKLEVKKARHAKVEVVTDIVSPETKKISGGVRGWFRRMFGSEEMTPEKKRVEGLADNVKLELADIYDGASHELLAKSTMDLESAGMIRGSYDAYENVFNYAKKKFTYDEEFWTAFADYLENLEIDGADTFVDSRSFAETLDHFSGNPKIAKGLLLDLMHGGKSRAVVILGSERLLNAESKEIRNMIIEGILGCKNIQVLSWFMFYFALLPLHYLKSERRVTLLLRYCEEHWHDKIKPELNVVEEYLDEGVTPAAQGAANYVEEHEPHTDSPYR